MRSTSGHDHRAGMEAFRDDVGMAGSITDGLENLGGSLYRSRFSPKPEYFLATPDGNLHLLTDAQVQSILTVRGKSFFSKLDDKWNISETAKQVAPLFLGAPALAAAATAGAIAAPAIALTTAVAPLALTGVAAKAASISTPDEIKSLGEKFNVGQHASDWKSWAESAVAVSTLGLSRDEHVRDEVKRLGEKWNVGNNSVDTLKSIANVASIVGALSGVGTIASALLGSSTLPQGVMTVAREYARTSLRDKVIGKAGEELADPYIDHLVKKARRDAQALADEERALIAQYQAMRPGVNALMLMAVENPNGLDRQQMQVIVNYQRDLERERAVAENRPDPPDEEWPAYYTRFLAEYGIAWEPTESPGNILSVGGGLTPAGQYPAGSSLEDRMAIDRARATMAAPDVKGRYMDRYGIVATSPRVPQSLTLPPALKNALEKLYPPTGA